MTPTRIKVSAECEWKPGADGEFYFASLVDAELEKLRTELAAAMNEIASQNMTIKTLSEHIANSIDDGEEWLNSYVGTGEIS